MAEEAKARLAAAGGSASAPTERESSVAPVGPGVTHNQEATTADDESAFLVRPCNSLHQFTKEHTDRIVAGSR